VVVVQIDPNVRGVHNWARARFENVIGTVPVLDETVIVVEPEAELRGIGVVQEVNVSTQLLYIELDWTSFRYIRVDSFFQSP